MNVCQPGSNLLSAGYCMYSSSVILVISIGKGVRRPLGATSRTRAAHRAAPAPPDAPRSRTQVYGFTLDQNLGEFVLSHNNIKIPDSGKIYSFNEGNYAMWSPGLKKYMDSLKVRTVRRAQRRLQKPRRAALTRLRLRRPAARRTTASRTARATSAPWWATSTAPCCTAASTVRRRRRDRLAVTRG